MGGTNTFTANLTEAVMEGSVITMTSTLTFTFTASLNGLTVECSVLGSGQVIRRMATVEEGTDPPSTPQSPQLNVSGYGVGGANVTVEWMYPDDGPVADNYTVSLSVGEPVTTTELMAIIEKVPYDQPLTGTVVAANCIDKSSPATFEVPCGVPRPPVSGSIEAFTVTEVVYRCDPGFGPGTVVTATCESGNWTPTPPADLMCMQLTTVQSKSLAPTTNFGTSTTVSMGSSLQTVEPSLSPTQTLISMDTCADSSVDSVTIAVSVTVTFVVAFLLGTATGAVVLYCTVGKQSDSNCRPCPKSQQEQNLYMEPAYETVTQSTGAHSHSEAVELKENPAYGPVKH